MHSTATVHVQVQGSIDSVLHGFTLQNVGQRLQHSGLGSHWQVETVETTQAPPPLDQIPYPWLVN